MRAMFRLTGKPGVDILLILLWWPYAASIFVVVWLFLFLSQANRRVDEADRAAGRRSRLSNDESEASARARAAHDHTARLPVRDDDRRAAVDAVTRRLSSDGAITNDKLDQLADLTLAIGAARTRGELAAVVGVPLETFGPLKAALEPISVRWKRRVPIVAATLGVLLMVAGGVAQEFGAAFLGSLSIIAAVAVWTWRRARGSRVWKTVGFGFLTWAIAVPVAAAVAPPETPSTGPRIASWSEWCTTYSNADGSLKVGPLDIRPAVLAAERLPVSANPIAAREVRYAVTYVGSDASSYARSNSHNQRSAAEHMTNAAVVICKP
ncbi:hypothetical protein [Dactylosporangium salmoneum]|uniref:Uncharacterized protein n=1 Tax=Dactylosporangium salmoneum TaxID=53361 RepID=A0ABN3HLI4_9ACTN